MLLSIRFNERSYKKHKKIIDGKKTSTLNEKQKLNMLNAQCFIVEKRKLLSLLSLLAALTG